LFQIRANRSVSLTLALTLWFTSAIPSTAYGDFSGVRNTAAACMLMFASLGAENPSRAQAPDPVPAVAKEEKKAALDLPALRNAMDRPDPKAEIPRLVKLIEEQTRAESERRVQAAQSAQATTDAIDSIATRVYRAAMEEPRMQIIGLSIAATELLFVGFLWYRARIIRAQLIRRHRTALGTDKAMKESLDKLNAAADRVTLSIRQIGEEARKEILAKVEEFPEPLRTKLKEELAKTVEAGSEAISLEAALRDLEQAYDAVQKLATARAEVMTAAGDLEVKPPPALESLKAEVARHLQAVMRLGTTWENVRDFYAQVDHQRLQAERGLGRDRNIPARIARGVMRKFLVGLFLVAVPTLVMGLAVSRDAQKDFERREQDLNDAITAAHERLNLNLGLVANMTRPTLKTLETVWRDDPRLGLAGIECPVTVMPSGVDNPGLDLVQMLSYQTVLELGGPLNFKYDEAFYRLLIPKLMTYAPATAHFDAKTREQIISDMAYRAARIHNEPPIPGLGPPPPQNPPGPAPQDPPFGGPSPAPVPRP